MILQKLFLMEDKRFQTITTPNKCMFVDVIYSNGKFYAVGIIDSEDKETKNIEIVMYRNDERVFEDTIELFFIRTITIKRWFRKDDVVAVYNKKRFADEKRPYRPVRNK